MTGQFYNEIDRHAIAWLKNLMERGEIPAGTLCERSISDLSPAELEGYAHAHFFAGVGVWAYALRLAGWPENVPIWTGSCPCQPFSTAGRRKGFSDGRHLWPAWFRLIDELRPVSIVGEQVAGPDGLRWLDSVFADLEGAGYSVGAANLCAAGVGAPHIRQRLFWVAYSGEERRWKGRSSQEDRGESVEFSRYSSVSRMGDSRFSRSGRDGGGVSSTQEESTGQGKTARNIGDESFASGPTSGFWRDVEWIFCKDGKHRATEPGTFPLVDGAAFRVGSGSTYEGRSRAGMLRGYGNGLVAPLAATFLRAVIDVLGIEQGEAA